MDTATTNTRLNKFLEIKTNLTTFWEKQTWQISDDNILPALLKKSSDNCVKILACTVSLCKNQVSTHLDYTSRFSFATASLSVFIIIWLIYYVFNIVRMLSATNGRNLVENAWGLNNLYTCAKARTYIEAKLQSYRMVNFIPP